MTLCSIVILLVTYREYIMILHRYGDVFYDINDTFWTKFHYLLMKPLAVTTR